MSAPATSARKGRVTRVMVVDDSIVARAVLVRLLDAQPDIAVVAQAGSGITALEELGRHDIDVILLDIEMPGMTGLEALPAIIARGGNHRVMIVSSACAEGAESSIQALRLGAADTLLKPAAGGLAGTFSRELIEKVRRIAAAEDGSRTHWPMPAAVPPSHPAPRVNNPARAETADALECIAIGASTGGVHALASFFAALPARIEQPILVTQHLPEPFMAYFAGQLHEMSGRRARLASDGMPLLPGTILLAPGNAHLGLARTRGLVHVKLIRRPMPSGCTPSVDPMLSSVAQIFGPAGLGIVLSGMGRDGEIGAEDMVRAGGAVLAQDAASSVVWGMPGAVAQRGLAARVLPPAALAAEVITRVEQGKVPAWT